jgi:inner membrane protein YidH
MTRVLPGRDPDPRFTFANERTFLAWNRTSLALIAGGLVASELVTAGPRLARMAIALVPVLVGGVLSSLSYSRWRQAEAALRLDEPLPDARLAAVLVATVVLLTMLCATLLIAELA